jgi:inosine-uridine nucleoside N-ribohydrolase
MGLACSGGLSADDDSGVGDHQVGAERTLRVLLSTDVAIGLIDTHGGKSLSPVTFDANHTYTTDADVSPQDIDDGLALAMALNLDAAGVIEVVAIAPTYGNATLPAEMIVARQITRVLKGREDIRILPGATSPASQTLHPTPTWFDGETVPVEGPEGSFAAACGNQGVALMRDRLRSSRGPVTLLAIGPLTDVACLLTTAPEWVIRKIREIIAIASRVEGESLLVNGKVVNDFNFRIDPVGGTLLLGASTHVPIRLMAFQLTGQTSQAGDVIAFDAATYPGRQPPTPASKASFRWLLEAAGPRNDFWSGIFGTPEGPFDQYALVAAIEPDLFDCQAGLAYVQQCPFPAWSPDYPTDANGDPTEAPYNAPDNPCTDHGPANGGALSEVPAELVVTLDLDDDGPLVRGITGIDGNIPALDRPARAVTVCTDFASDFARQQFEDVLKKWTW